VSPEIRQKLSDYAQLMRIDRPIGTLLLLWPTFWALWLATRGHPPVGIVLIFVVGTFLMRSAGCVINDYADRHFDGEVERTRQRPFARKAVSEREALLLAGALALLSLGLILPLNRLTQELSIIAVLLSASYPYTKRFFPIPQAYLGIAFAFGIPMSFAATTNAVPLVAWVMTLATGFWVIAYDTAYAMADKPDDLKLGLKSSAITFGRHDVRAIMICHGGFLILMTWVGLQLDMGLLYYASILFSIFLINIQYHEIKTRDRALCFKAFLDNNQVGAVIFSGVLMDYLLR